jgi:hypothetical protein
MHMTGHSRSLARWALIGALFLMVFSSLPGPVSALPGDLTGAIELEEPNIDAEPTDSAVTVTFHGNLTFEQPIWQSATATLTVDIDRNWTATPSPATVSNRGPGTQTFQVTVEVPPSARGGDVANVMVAARFSTRLGNPMGASASATVTVRPWVGYRLSVTGPMELVLPQGGSGKLQVPLRNVGNVADTFSSSVPYWYGLRPLGLVLGPSGWRFT